MRVVLACWLTLVLGTRSALRAHPHPATRCAGTRFSPREKAVFAGGLVGMLWRLLLDAIVEHCC